MTEKDRHRRAFPPGRRQHRDDAPLRAGSACCRRPAVKKGGRFRDMIATMARPNSSTPLVRLVLRSTRSGTRRPTHFDIEPPEKDTGRPSSIDERDLFKAERLSDHTGSRRFGSHDRMGTMLRKGEVGGWSSELDSANTGGSGRIVGLYQHQIERLPKDLGRHGSATNSSYGGSLAQAGPAGTTQLKNAGLFRCLF